VPRQNKINTLHVFTVEGSGEFPFDMLRYDTCWPEREFDTPKLGRQFDGPRLGPARSTKRTVGMIGLRGPTVDRWASFGWKVGDTVQERSVG